MAIEKLKSYGTGVYCVLIPPLAFKAKFCINDCCLRLESYDMPVSSNEILGTVTLIVFVSVGSEVICVRYLSFEP